jgi:Uma2 family endonuclease
MELQTTIQSPPVPETRSELEIQYELERGKPMPSLNHSRVQRRLTVYFDNNYGEHYEIFPELEINFTIKNAVPDLSVYPIQADNWKKDVIRRSDLPILLIEILSPRQAFDDIVEKINDIYFPAGMVSIWVVLPSAQSIMVFQPNKKPVTYSDGILKDTVSGFDVDLNFIFR